MNTFYGLFLLCSLVVIHEFGHYLAAKLLGVRVLVFSIGFGRKIFKYSYKNTEYCLSAIPIGGYVELLEHSLSNNSKTLGFHDKSFFKKTLIIVAGPITNLLASLLILLLVNVDLQKKPIQKIGYIVNNSVADVIGLKSGEQIVLDGKKIGNSNAEILNFLNEYKNKKNNNIIKIDRLGNLKIFNTIPNKALLLNSISNTEAFEDAGVIPPVFSNISVSGSSFSEILKQTLIVMREFIYITISSISGLFYSESSIEQIGGPITIIETAGQSKFYGTEDYFANMAFLGTNLGLLNLLPLPTLDGGRLFVLIIETLFKKSFLRKICNIFTILGFIIFIFLIYMAISNDIRKFFN